MTDDEIMILMEINNKYFSSVKEAAYEMFCRTNEFIGEQQKKNSVHRHFKTKKEMNEAMYTDWNPYNTFSFGKKPSKESIERCRNEGQ